MQKRNTIVGTEDYIAPEILDGETSGPAADIWSFGVILYMMLSGASPFKGANQYQTFLNIQSVTYTFPEDPTFFTPEAKDLIQKLLVRDPSQRLGAGIEGFGNDYNDLRRHPFFDGIDFDKIFLM